MANVVLKKVSSPMGKAHITAGFNNTIITVTDNQNQVVVWGTAGLSGFKGARRSSPYAASVTAEALARRAVEHGIREVSVSVRGPGAGRINAIKSLRAGGLTVTSIADTTPIPHNGCRPKNRRRV